MGRLRWVNITVHFKKTGVFGPRLRNIFIGTDLNDTGPSIAFPKYVPGRTSDKNRPLRCVFAHTGAVESSIMEYPGLTDGGDEARSRGRPRPGSLLNLESG